MGALIDLTGQQFGNLVVLERGENVPDGKAMKPGWVCKCLLCGKIKTISGKNLRNGKSTSCGCIRGGKLFIDETGNKYGKLTVISRVANNSQGRAQWKCKCECGSYTIVEGGNLRSGASKSCGCVKSYGEIFIRQWLVKHNIPFYVEYSYNDLYSNKGYLLRFDFALADKNDQIKCLIEFQGIQHFYNTDWGKTQREETDQKKKEYCLKHNIPLYYINYNEDWEKKLENIVMKEGD